LSVVTFIVIGLAVGGTLRGPIAPRRRKDWFENVLPPEFSPVTILALLAMLVLIFAFRAENLTGKSLHVLLIAVPISSAGLP
jgi:ACR3 family arsenite transporter